MITQLKQLPDGQLTAQLERACPAEMAMLEAELPLLGHGLSGLWLQRIGGTDTALLLRTTAGGVVLVPLVGADLDEISEFLAAVGFGSITLPEPFATKFALPHTRQEHCTLMEWRGPQPPEAPGPDLRPVTTAQLLQNTLAAFGPVIPAEEREEWQWAFGLKTRRGTAQAMGLWQGEQLLAAAALSHIGKTAALVGFVGTPPAHRGRGYARRLAALAAAQAVQAGCRPMLCCKPELEKLYRAAGFAAIGSQAVVRPILQDKNEG